MRVGSETTLVGEVLHANCPNSRVLFLTGAGISAESGVPTFRGEAGYWRVGSRNYHPQELATHAAFVELPNEVWSWYLYRRAVCRAAEPNPGHLAIASLQASRPDNIALVTQNVDGLHRRAGSPERCTYEIHGNIDLARCTRGCARHFPIPFGPFDVWEKERKLTSKEYALLRCPSCAAPGRPHVLWFDETYDEENFYFETAMRTALHCDLLVVVGTTGSTNLPLQIGALVAQRGAAMLVVNPEPNPFSELAERNENGAFLQGTAGQWIPEICDQLLG